MIDWFTIKCPPCDGFEIDGGKVCFIKPDGSVDYLIDKYHMVSGSYDSRISILANPSEIVISGNPTKFLQGHNLFGIEDFSRLLSGFLLALAQHVPLTQEWLNQVMAGNFTVTRLDVTYSYRLKNQGDVIKWLNAMEQVSTGKRQAVSRSKGTTVYVGKNSRRSSIKFYDKEGEIKAGKLHALSDKLTTDQYDFLNQWVKGILRCEVVFRGMCLKDEFNLKKRV